jgi:hypothetical protein
MGLFFFLVFFAIFHNLMRIKNEGVKCKKGLFPEKLGLSCHIRRGKSVKSPFKQVSNKF